MKWIQAGSYLVQPTHQNIPVIEFFSNLDEPQPIALVYNPEQEHALILRNKEEGIVLDYLDPKSIELFNQTTQAAVCEMDEKEQRVRYYYRISVQRVKEKLGIKLKTKKVV